MTLLTDYPLDFARRLDGPFHFRMYIQPLTAALLAARAGIADSRAARGAFGWTVFSDPAQRRYLIADGWKGISRVFFLACALDLVYQLIVWRGIKPLQALTVAIALAVLPYALLRGAMNRLWSVITRSKRGD
jgi:hypothetical protein